MQLIDYVLMGCVVFLLGVIGDIIARGQAAIRADLTAHEEADERSLREIRDRIDSMRSEVMQALANRVP